jgi:hypothetical protein
MMKKTDKTEFLVALSSVAELFGKTLTDATIELWWSVLKDLPLEDIKSGFSRHLRDAERGRFMPAPADIIGKTVAKRTALVAWAEVEEHMRLVGAYRSVEFADGTINAVIKDMGGWPWLCRQNLDEPWTQREFERRYREYQGYGRELHERLIGISDQENTNSGYLAYVKPAIQIGDGGSMKQLSANMRLIKGKN